MVFQKKAETEKMAGAWKSCLDGLKLDGIVQIEDLHTEELGITLGISKSTVALRDINSGFS